MYLFYLCRPMIIVSNETPIVSRQLSRDWSRWDRDWAGMRGKSRREFSGTRGSRSYVKYVKQNVQGDEGVLNSWSPWALGFISFYLIRRRSFFPFVWKTRRKRRLIYFLLSRQMIFWCPRPAKRSRGCRLRIHIACVAGGIKALSIESMVGEVFGPEQKPIKFDGLLDKSHPHHEQQELPVLSVWCFRTL